ncbi:UNVERIFIED_CONTAM: hypothetical protein FKN15_020267 [Acipenser sinensis]
MQGTAEEMIPSYLDECMWRERRLPPEGACTLLTCVPGSLQQREPALYLPVFLAYSTRGSLYSTYLCSRLTTPEGAHQLLTFVTCSLHQRESLPCLPVFLAYSNRGRHHSLLACVAESRRSTGRACSSLVVEK